MNYFLQKISMNARLESKELYAEEIVLRKKSFMYLFGSNPKFEISMMVLRK